jgi:hypothetical protein
MFAQRMPRREHWNARPYPVPETLRALASRMEEREQQVNLNSGRTANRVGGTPTPENLVAILPVPEPPTQVDSNMTGSFVDLVS